MSAAPATPVPARTVPGVPPALQRKLRRFFACVQFVSPALAARLALRLFLTPPRRRLDAGDAPVVTQAERAHVSLGDDSFTQWTWGRGAPTVVLVHGWGSHAARFAGFIAPLRAAGFTVVGIDAPAHGVSPGTTSHLGKFRDALAHVLRAHAPVHAVIGHSLGGAAALAVFAELREFLPRKVCLFGVPENMDYILESFALMLGFRPRALAALRARFTRQFGVAASDVSIAATAPHVNVPVMIVHDEEDNVAPIDQGRALAAALPGATLLWTRGFGHNGALRDAATIGRVVAFLTE